MKFALLGLLVVLLIGFFVVVWKAARDWRWYNIVAVCFTMLLAVVFLFPTAFSLKSRAAWHKVKEDLEKQATDLEVEHRLIKYGDPNDPDYGQGVVDLGLELSKLGIEAGRRWRNLQFQGVANNRITLVETQAAAAGGVEGIPDAGDAAAPAPAAPAQDEGMIDSSMVVYGFMEMENQQQLKLPNFYVGEFRVESSTPNSVTLAPTGPLEQSQLKAINEQQAVIGTPRASSWSLYELLPLDGHQPFVAPGSEESEDNFFGRIDTDMLNQLLGNRVSPETLNQYIEDGRQATDDDPPLSRWWKVEFIKSHEIEVDSPDSQGGVLEGGFFDPVTGLARDGRLKRGDGEPVKFEKGQQILVKEEVANDLINQGVAELRKPFYLRPLNDYRFVLRHIRLRLTELANRQSELDVETKVLEEAIEKTESMLVTNQEIKLKLEQDLAQFRVEKTAIESYTEQLREQVEAMRAEMARLHQENRVLEQQIEEKHLAIQRRLDALTSVE